MAKSLVVTQQHKLDSAVKGKRVNLECSEQFDY